MDRQKPTRLLFLFSTVFSSVLVCFVLYFQVLAHVSDFHFSSFPAVAGGGGSPAGASFREETSGSFREVLGFVRDVEDTNSSENGFGEEVGSFSGASDSGFEEKDSVLGDTHFREVSSSSTETSGHVAEMKAIDSEGAHLRKPTGVPCNTSGVSHAENTEKGRWGACDVSRGKWVFDESYPHYSSVSCPFIDEGFNCQENGRTDGDYMKWRWQPDDCNIPRFDAVKMLEMLRGKRLVFAGDSINRNQWESLLCMLRTGVTDPRRVYEAHGRKITKGKGSYRFKFVDYDCSVEYYVSHFLVQESKARVGRKRKPTLRIDAVDRGSSKWRGADILVFNSAHWWSHHKTKAGKDYYQEKDHVHSQLDVSTALSRALTTWASWVDRNVDPRRTQVFFRSSAPSHFRGGGWNSGGHCTESTLPLNHTLIRARPPEKFSGIVDGIMREMKTPVTLLNITSLSGLRIDGHPSVYGKHPSKGPRASGQDCSHWCLPGVPDTWNQLLYFHLLSKRRTAFTD